MTAQGFVTLLAGIVDGHGPSERLHACFGFVRCGTFHRVGWKQGGWRDVGYWERQLQPTDWPPRPLRPVDGVWREQRG
jgi:phosphinothricin acetyltransferase